MEVEAIGRLGSAIQNIQKLVEQMGGGGNFAGMMQAAQGGDQTHHIQNALHKIESVLQNILQQLKASNQ